MSAQLHGINLSIYRAVFLSSITWHHYKSYINHACEYRVGMTSAAVYSIDYGTSLRFILAAATSIVSTILPITSAEPALFGVYADDLLLRWRALRGFRNTLEDDLE